MTNRNTLLFLFSLVIGLTACDEADELGTSLTPGRTSVVVTYTDTVTVRTSTVLLDSVNTTGTAVLLLGRYEDSRLGKVTAKSFFELGPAASVNLIDEAAVYDSLVLLLDYTYTYGDTTQTQHLAVHTLAQDLESNDTYYNFDEVPTAANPIGSKTFKPRPASRVPLRIRLSDNLGQSLFKRMQDESLTNDDFKTFVKGLALVPGENDNGAILGFKTISDSTTLRLYYHENVLTSQTDVVDFTLLDSGIRFNQIKNDRKGTLLAPLVQSRKALPAETSAEETFLLAGIGLATRIDFPTIRTIGQQGRIQVNKAELVFEPVKNTYNRYAPLPSYLEVYQVDGVNYFLSNTIVTNAFLNQDVISFGYYYSMDLSAYFYSEMRTEGISKNGLLLTLPLSSFSITTTRLAIGGSKHATNPLTLKLYYTSLQNQGE